MVLHWRRNDVGGGYAAEQQRGSHSTAGGVGVGAGAGVSGGVGGGVDGGGGYYSADGMPLVDQNLEPLNYNNVPYNQQKFGVIRRRPPADRNTDKSRPQQNMAFDSMSSSGAAASTTAARGRTSSGGGGGPRCQLVRTRFCEVLVGSVWPALLQYAFGLLCWGIVRHVFLGLRPRSIAAAWRDNKLLSVYAFFQLMSQGVACRSIAALLSIASLTYVLYARAVTATPYCRLTNGVLASIPPVRYIHASPFAAVASAGYHSVGGGATTTHSGPKSSSKIVKGFYGGGIKTLLNAGFSNPALRLLLIASMPAVTTVAMLTLYICVATTAPSTLEFAAVFFTSTAVSLRYYGCQQNVLIWLFVSSSTGIPTVPTVTRFARALKVVTFAGALSTPMAVIVLLFSASRRVIVIFESLLVNPVLLLTNISSHQSHSVYILWRLLPLGLAVYCVVYCLEMHAVSLSQLSYIDLGLSPTDYTDGLSGGSCVDKLIAAAALSQIVSDAPASTCALTGAAYAHHSGAYCPPAATTYSNYGMTGAGIVNIEFIDSRFVAGRSAHMPNSYAAQYGSKPSGPASTQRTSKDVPPATQSAFRRILYAPLTLAAYTKHRVLLVVWAALPDGVPELLSLWSYCGWLKAINFLPGGFLPSTTELSTHTATSSSSGSKALISDSASRRDVPTKACAWFAAGGGEAAGIALNQGVAQVLSNPEFWVVYWRSILQSLDDARTAVDVLSRFAANASGEVPLEQAWRIQKFLKKVYDYDCTHLYTNPFYTKSAGGRFKDALQVLCGRSPTQNYSDSAATLYGTGTGSGPAQTQYGQLGRRMGGERLHSNERLQAAARDLQNRGVGPGARVAYDQAAYSSSHHHSSSHQQKDFSRQGGAGEHLGSSPGSREAVDEGHMYNTAIPCVDDLERYPIPQSTKDDIFRELQELALPLLQSATLFAVGGVRWLYAARWLSGFEVPSKDTKLFTDAPMQLLNSLVNVEKSLNLFIASVDTSYTYVSPDVKLTFSTVKDEFLGAMSSLAYLFGGTLSSVDLPTDTGALIQRLGRTTGVSLYY